MTKLTRLGNHAVVADKARRATCAGPRAAAHAVMLGIVVVVIIAAVAIALDDLAVLPLQERWQLPFPLPVAATPTTIPVIIVIVVVIIVIVAVVARRGGTYLLRATRARVSHDPGGVLAKRIENRH